MLTPMVLLLFLLCLFQVSLIICFAIVCVVKIYCFRLVAERESNQSLNPSAPQLS